MISKEQPIKIMTTSDIHYFSPRLHDRGPLFKKTMSTADGKHTLYIREILDAFLEKVRQEKPDFLLISGDLTFNGEKLSHEELAKEFEQLQKEGIQVLVIPGNHDVNFPFSYKYKNDSFSNTDNISFEDFKKLYGKSGYEDNLSSDVTSLSYVYPLSEDVWLFALDANANGHKGEISKETMVWLEKWLKKAQDEHKVILTMTHQNILSHNLLTSPGYLLFNHDELYDLLSKYGATLNYSGHMHIQHIKTVGKLTTIASGSLAVHPNLYGLTHIDSKRQIHYQAFPLDVEGWAKKHHVKDHRLLDFSRQSKTYFNQVWGWQIAQELQDYGVNTMCSVGLVDFACQVINSYLAGEIYLRRNEYLDNPLYEKWKKLAPGSFYESYLESILEDPANTTSDKEIFLQANTNEKENCCE